MLPIKTWLLSTFTYYLKQTRLPVYIGQHPAGTSTQNILHYSQVGPYFQNMQYDIFVHELAEIKYGI